MPTTMGNTRKKRSGIGMKLTALRDKMNLSQTDAAKKVGVSYRTWSNWERGTRKPHAAFLALIREKLGEF